MSNSELHTLYLWQCFGCVVLALLILLVAASAAEQIIRDRISQRRRDRFNQPLTLHPIPLEAA